MRDRKIKLLKFNEEKNLKGRGRKFTENQIVPDYLQLGDSRGSVRGLGKQPESSTVN